MKKQQNKDLKSFKPLTPSLRQRIQVNYSEFLKNNKKFKKLTKGKIKTGGRNNFGRLTAFKKGQGHKKSYRFLSSYDLKNILPFLTVNSIEYDPFRTAFINCCFFYEGGFFQYTLSAQNTKQGSILGSNYYFSLPNAGSPCTIKYAKVGDFIYNINLNAAYRYYIASAAGTFCKIMKKDRKTICSRLVLPSGNLYSISFPSLGFLGKASNYSHRFITISKAGRNRWLGKRPTVRGVAMNPVDHVHGGGEGKSSGGRPSSTPWGFYTKGKKTRKKKEMPYFIRQYKQRKKKK